MNRVPARRIAVQCCIALVLFRLGNLEEDFLEASVSAVFMNCRLVRTACHLINGLNQLHQS